MAIVPTPTYPVTGEEVSLSVSGATGSEFVFELVTPPDDSSLSASVQERLQTGRSVQSAVDDDSASDAFTGDSPGAYVFKVYEYSSSSGSPAFEGDPAGEIEKLLVATQTTTVYLGALMDLPILTAAGDGATLRLQVNDATVRAASLLNFTSSVSESAAEQASVIASLAALVGTSVAALGDTLTDNVSELHSSYLAHLADTTPHSSPDTTNTLRLSEATKDTGSIEVLNLIREQYLKHAQDSSNAATSWHEPDLDDLENLPLAGPASTISEATVLFSDLAYRGFARHLDAFDPTTEPLVHQAQDTTNTISASSLLDDIIVDFFDAIVDEAQAAERGENPGDIEATVKYGFSRATP